MYPVIVGVIILVVLALAYYAWTLWSAPQVCTPAQIAKIGAKGMACAPSSDGKWLVIPHAGWTASYQRPDIKGSPKAGLSLAACQAFCAADPACVTWFSEGAGGRACYGFSAAPTALQGNATWTAGVSAAAAGA